VKCEENDEESERREKEQRVVRQKDTNKLVSLNEGINTIHM
jgi:hypothetical protein